MRRASLTYYNIWVVTGDTLACYVEIWSLGTSPLCVSLSTEQGQRHSGVLRLWWDHKRRGTFDSWFLVVAWTCVRIASNLITTVRMYTPNTVSWPSQNTLGSCGFYIGQWTMLSTSCFWPSFKQSLFDQDGLVYFRQNKWKMTNRRREVNRTYMVLEMGASKV